MNHKLLLPEEDQALPGREQRLQIENLHYVTGRPMQEPYPEIQDDCAKVLLGLGCFWGAERKFWNLEGVYTTAVGYTAGSTPNPTYEEVCSCLTGHTEAVLVVYQPSQISLDEILQTFFEAHDPTQGMRQGNDIGTQYRSGIYVFDAADLAIAKDLAKNYQSALSEANYPPLTTEIELAGEFYLAEQYHQQYLAKNPNGYCGIGGTGVSCAI